MATKDKSDHDFFDKFIRRSITLNRAFEGEAAKYAVKVRKQHDKILKRIETEYGKLKTRDLNRMSKEIGEQLKSYYLENIKVDEDAIVGELIKKEVAWNIATLNTVIETTVPLAVPNAKRIAEKAFTRTYQGHTFNFWYKKVGIQSANAVEKMLVNAHVTGKPTGQIVNEIAATFNKSSREVRTLTRSYLQAAAQDTRLAVFQENDDLIEGYIWSSTLDGRTTPHICGVRDGKLYDKDFKPVGHDYPWDAGPGKIHFNCRSAFIPKIVGMDLKWPRPAVGAGPDYERGDMKTNSGTVRKPTRKTVEEGIFSVGRVNSDTDYESFLRRQPKAFVSDVLGSEEKATQFLSGKTTLGGFAESATPTLVSEI